MSSLSSDRAEDATWIRYCDKLGRQFLSDRVTFDEFAHGLTVGAVSGSDDGMRQCVEGIPAEVLPRYAAFLRDFLVSSDFRPAALPFLVGVETEVEVRAVQDRLRPRYVRLDQVVQDRLASLT